MHLVECHAIQKHAIDEVVLSVTLSKALGNMQSHVAACGKQFLETGLVCSTSIKLLPLRI